MANRKRREGSSLLSPSAIYFRERHSITIPHGVVVFECDRIYRDPAEIVLAVSLNLPFIALEE